jgi:hypothetical protein
MKLSGIGRDSHAEPIRDFLETKALGYLRQLLIPQISSSRIGARAGVAGATT